jgi:hypothetical protein
MIDELDVPVRSKFWLYTFILLFITVSLNGLLSEHLTVSGADPQKLTHYGKRYLVVGGPKWAHSSNCLTEYERRFPVSSHPDY